MKLIIVGGGWAGCAAAYIAAKQGLLVTILERTDLLLGTGQVGGIMRNNGRFTATEELIALGAGDLFSLIDANLTHHNLTFPGHDHASLYDITKVPTAVYDALTRLGVTIHFMCRVTSVTMEQGRLVSVSTAPSRLHRLKSTGSKPKSSYQSAPEGEGSCLASLAPEGDHHAGSNVAFSNLSGSKPEDSCPSGSGPQESCLGADHHAGASPATNHLSGASSESEGSCRSGSKPKESCLRADHLAGVSHSCPPPTQNPVVALM